MGFKVDGRSLHNATLRTNLPPDSGRYAWESAWWTELCPGLYGISRACHRVLVSQNSTLGSVWQVDLRDGGIGRAWWGGGMAPLTPPPDLSGPLRTHHTWVADGPWPGASSSPEPIPAGGGDSPLRLYEWPVGVAGPRAGRSGLRWACLGPGGAFG